MIRPCAESAVVSISTIPVNVFIMRPSFMDVRSRLTRSGSNWIPPTRADLRPILFREFCLRRSPHSFISWPRSHDVEREPEPLRQ